MFFFCFKQKTAYEMRISDWSSDVCSSDLSPEIALGAARDVLLEAATPAGAKYASLKANLRTLVIDEAHIVESWGRSFRPDFQRLPALVAELRQLNPDLNVVLLSATLPPAARQVLRHAYISSGPWQIGRATV